MLVLVRNDKSPRYSPNILPCRINHDGPVNASQRYWAPKSEDNGTKTSYLRGRQLRGRVVQLPKSYRGAIMRKTDKTIVETSPEEDALEDGIDEKDKIQDLQNAESEAVHTAVMEEVASFDQVTLWGHDALLDEVDNPYGRGVTEWIAFASAMHSYDTTDAARE